MKSNIQLVHNSTAAAIAIVLAAAAPIGQAEADNEEIPFDEAHLFFELNNTDGDLGIHALIDGDAWKRLEIEDPREHRMLKVYVQGRLRKQGITEFFFESAEPTFDELAPKDFFKRFPEGEYEIEGRTLEGEELEGEVNLSHVMPAPPKLTVNGVAAAKNCDEEPLPVFTAPVIISWEPVETSHPDGDGGGAGVQPPVAVTIRNYEVVVEIDDTPYKSSTILPPDVTEFQVPQEILELAEEEVKYEVLAREENYNQTAVESCFEID